MQYCSQFLLPLRGTLFPCRWVFLDLSATCFVDSVITLWEILDVTFWVVFLLSFAFRELVISLTWFCRFDLRLVPFVEDIFGGLLLRLHSF